MKLLLAAMLPGLAACATARLPSSAFDRGHGLQPSHPDRVKRH